MKEERSVHLHRWPENLVPAAWNLFSLPLSRRGADAGPGSDGSHADAQGKGQGKVPNPICWTREGLYK